MTPPTETSNPSPPLVAPPSPLERLQMVKTYRSDKTLIDGEDYGIIPGAQSKKPTLLKPGAQKLCGLFGLAPTIKNVNRVFKDDLIAYEVQMQVVAKATGIVEGEGLGMCNSRERKYKTKDSHDIANTILKMAEKRALVDATLNALGISSLFTQDIEDMVPEPPKTPTRPEPEPLASHKQRSGVRALAKRFWDAETFVDRLTEYLASAYHKTLEELTVSEAEKVYRMFGEELAKDAPVQDEVTQPSTARIDALNAKCREWPNYNAFVLTWTDKGYSWATDEDVAAFENAATPHTKDGMAVIAEHIGMGAWSDWENRVLHDELGLEVKA